MQPGAELILVIAVAGYSAVAIVYVAIAMFVVERSGTRRLWIVWLGGSVAMAVWGAIRTQYSALESPLPGAISLGALGLLAFGVTSLVVWKLCSPERERSKAVLVLAGFGGFWVGMLVAVLFGTLFVDELLEFVASRSPTE